MSARLAVTTMALWIAAFSIAPARGYAQSLDRLGAPFGAEWAYSEAPPSARVGPRASRRASQPLITLGSMLSAAGYGGSIAIGLEVQRLGAGGGCRDTYATDHFAPFAGAFVGLVRGLDCANVGLGWMALDFLSIVSQLAGAVLLCVGGLAGERAIALDGPVDVELAPWAGPDGAGVVLGLPID